VSTPPVPVPPPVPPPAWHTLLLKTGERLAVAESLTGGMLAARVTAQAGASGHFVGGVVSYATEVKRTLLGVPDEVVEGPGVVSGECARAMANGVRELLGATWALSTTGVAGPDRQEDKPAGTVYVGLAGPPGSRSLALQLTGDREEIRRAAVDAALSALASALSEHHGASGRPVPREDPDLG
jgi:nicotinamide-nucleotide amidase